MPRPEAMPVRRIAGRGEGRACQPAALAADRTTSISRGSARCRRRYSTGSVVIAAATSSMNDSCANVFCRRSGDRSGPVKNDEATLWVRTRWLAIVPVPPQRPETQPLTYDGTALLLLAKPAGSGAGERGVNACGSKPARKPDATLPGLVAPGRPPLVGDHDS